MTDSSVEPTRDWNRFEGALDRVLRRELPHSDGLISATRLSGGASQETYRVKLGNGELVALRRAPEGTQREITAEHPGLQTEAALLRGAAVAGVPVPQVLAVLSDEDGIGDGILMEWRQGETLGSRIVRSPRLAEIRPALAYECGQILARIHGIDVGNLENGLGTAALQTISPSELIHLNWDLYQELQTPQPMIDFTARWLLDNLPSTVKPALVHNDFRNGNLMISEDGIEAVLDWELAHLGDPMRDLGWLCVNSWRFGRNDLPVGGFGIREDLFAGYTSVSGIPVDAERVRFWEVFGSFWWAVHTLRMATSLRDANAPANTQVNAGPAVSVELPAIARRSSECQIDCVNLLLPGPVSVLQRATDGGEASTSNDELPTTYELVRSVRDFLRNDVMEGVDGRLNFMARVAGNSLDIVLRDFDTGVEARHEELLRLLAFFTSKTGTHIPSDLDIDELQRLRWQLVAGLRNGSISLKQPLLGEHLRQTVANQVAIDQPQYSGLAQVSAWESVAGNE